MSDQRALYTIANEIITDFQKEYKEARFKHLETGKGKMPKPYKDKYIHAMAYIIPMGCLNNINENYGFDTGKSIVAYALGNLQIWKGEKAKAIKKELNGMLK